jgi:predicted nucleotidyltransferase
MNILEKNMESVLSACEQFHVEQLFAFGSVLTERFNENSDIDFVVAFEKLDPLVYADNYFNLKFKLEEIFNRKIDLLEAKAIKNTFLIKSIDKTKKLIYARRDIVMA